MLFNEIATLKKKKGPCLKQAAWTTVLDLQYDHSTN